MKSLIGRLLHALTKRNGLVLNPAWCPLHRATDLEINGERTWVTGRILPVDYPFHVAENSRLTYRIFGQGVGKLDVVFDHSGGVTIAQWQGQFRLPGVLHVEVTREGLSIQGEKLAGSAAWRAGPTFGAVLRFTPQSDGRPLVRRISHLVKCGSTSDQEYFNGAVYRDYEAEPGMDVHAILNTLAAHRPLTGRLLDVGCATGWLVAAAQERGLDALGIEPSAWAWEKARARTGGACLRLDFDQARSADIGKTFAFVVMHSVLEHLAGPARALNLAWSLLEPGGILLVQTLNADSLMHRLQGASWSGFSDPTHRSPWITAHWLENTARSIGFKVAALRTYGVWNDRAGDPVWRAFGELLQAGPGPVLLAEGLGDFVEIILRKPQ